MVINRTEIALGIRAPSQLGFSELVREGKMQMSLRLDCKITCKKNTMGFLRVCDHWSVRLTKLSNCLTEPELNTSVFTSGS